MTRKGFKKPIEDPPPASSPSSSSSSSSSEEEEETQTPQTQKTPNLNVKPIATKPMEQTSNSKKPRSKPSVKASSSSAAAKRPSESEQEPKEVKRPKKKTGEEEGSGSAAAAASVVEEVKKTGEDEKKQLFQRLFTEDDEIAVLKGMLDYIVKKGDPFADTNAFHDFVKKSLHTDVSKSQLMYKIRRLKKRFENAGKGKHGEDRVFSNPHGQKIFELSKKIWGKEGLTGKLEASAAKSNGKKKGNSKALDLDGLKAELVSSPVKKMDALDDGEPMEVDKKSWGGSLFDKNFCVGGLEVEILKHGLDMIEGEKKEALEEKWRKLQVAELELFLKRNELVKEQAELILEAYKSEDA